MTRLIKIPRDLLRRAHAARGGTRREREKREKEGDRDRERERRKGPIRVDVRGRGASVEVSPRDTLCGCVEFDSRSKYSIRDEISRRPSAMRGRS